MVVAQQQKSGTFNLLVGKIDDILQYAVGDPMRYLVNWGRMYSLWPVHLETACCVPPDTVLLGDNKPISDYAIGDRVAGHKGITEVKQVFSRNFEGDLIEVRGRGMLPFWVTPEHPILTLPRHLKSGKGTYGTGQVWKHAGELIGAPAVMSRSGPLYPTATHDCLLLPRVKGSVGVRSLSLERFIDRRGLTIVRGRGENPPLRFPLTADSVWLLGLFVAEGWTTKGQDVYLSFGHDETSSIERVSRIASSLGYTPQTKVRDTTTLVRFSSAILARALRDWCGDNAGNKRIPDFVLYHRDVAILKSFMDGYLKGDGDVTVDSRGPVFERATATSKILALQIQLAYARLGLLARISAGAPGGTSKIMGRAANTKVPYQISVLSSDRKKSDFEVRPEYIAVPIRRISRVPYSGTVNNIETSDNTYVVSNAVVHNCSVEIGAAAGSRFDMERFGALEAFGSLRQCDLLIVMGTVTRKLAPRLKLVYDQMAEPKWVIAMGACSITGGLYFDSYNVLRGIDDIIPVDVYVPGCPPRAEAFLQGLVLLQEKIRRAPSLSGR